MLSHLSQDLTSWQRPHGCSEIVQGSEDNGSAGTAVPLVTTGLDAVLTSHTFNPKICIKAILNPDVYFRNIKKIVEEIKKKIQCHLCQYLVTKLLGVITISFASWTISTSESTKTYIHFQIYCHTRIQAWGLFSSIVTVTLSPSLHSCQFKAEVGSSLHYFREQPQSGSWNKVWRRWRHFSVLRRHYYFAWLC